MKTVKVKIKVSTQPYNYSDQQWSNSYKASFIYPDNNEYYNDVITVYPTVKQKKSVRNLICNFFNKLKVLRQYFN